MVCPASVLLESQVPGDGSSSYAEEGNAAHAVAAAALQTNTQAGDHVGMYYDPVAKELVPGGYSEDAMVEITEDMATDVQVYIDAIRSIAGSIKQDGTYHPILEMMVEQRVDVSDYLGVPDQFGTADVIVIDDRVPTDTEVQVHDLKFGRGVRVDAEENPQAMLYALGAYGEASLLADIKRVRIVIHQPRLQHLSEWDTTPEHLMEFAERAKTAGRKAIDIFETKVYDEDTELVPGEEQCKFCKAKATCPKLSRVVQEAVGATFEDLGAMQAPTLKAAIAEQTTDNLATQMKAVGLVELWTGAVRAETERRLLAQQEVPGFKLVQGRAGARRWKSAEAEEMMRKTFRLKVDEMYSFKLLSPTQIEARLKPWVDAEGTTREPVLGPRQWPKLKELVDKPPGKISVAPESDPRPPVAPADPGFAAVEDDDTAGGLL